MLQLTWHSTTIKTNQQANNMVKLFKETMPKIGAFDTETNGLHIILSTPFVFQFGWIDPNMREGYTFAVDIEQQPELARQVIKVWNKLAESLEIYLAHNTKFDLHMLQNTNLPYTHENLSDTMFYIRYAHDMLTPANGGPPMGLKDYTTRYLDHTAKDHEKLLKSERSAIAKDLNLKLKHRLKDCGIPPEKYKAKSYTLSVIQDIFKDPVIDYLDLPKAIKGSYMSWRILDIPDEIKPHVTGLVESDMIPYTMLDRQNLLRYAHKDIIYVLEVYLSLSPVIQARENEAGVQIENRLILPLFEMERVGFKTNKEYVEQSQNKMKNYILSRRQLLYDLAGREVNIGQHEVIKNILINDFGLQIESTGSEILDKVRAECVQINNTSAKQFIELIQELRTLEKWYSTYIIRFLNDLNRTDRLYTTINQVGAVSGRVTSDFQQFPKDGINTIDGEELFHPRKMVAPTGGDYEAIIYLDYSQIELRFQAFYTILVGSPDTNLCRAYMPYKCVNTKGETFDPKNPKHIKTWNAEWFLEEEQDIHWTPLDVHAATTEKATGLKPSHPDFKKLRSEIGKRVNFAKNYGAKYNKIKEMFPDKTDAEVHRIDDAYYAAFPGVKMYHQYCYNRANEFSYTTNLFGIKYYGVNGHKLINMLVQGSSAYYLKLKMRVLYEFQKRIKMKSRYMLNIHDELQYEWHKDDAPELLFQLKELMEEWPDTQVPIVAEVEYTRTSWGEKTPIHNLQEWKVICNA